MRPGRSGRCRTPSLQKFPGFGKDMEKNRAEAKRLLAEAGYLTNGLKVVLKNRNVRVPYLDFRHVRHQEWRQDRRRGRAPAARVGVLVRGWPGHRQLRAVVNPSFNFMDDPDQFLERYTTGDSNNWGRFSDPRLDEPLHPPVEGAGSAERRSSSPRSRGSCSGTRTTSRASGGRGAWCTGQR